MMANPYKKTEVWRSNISKGLLANRIFVRGEELAYLVGVYIGDGNIIRQGQGRRNYFRAKVKSLAFASSIHYALRSVIGYARIRQDKYGYYEVRGYSRELVEYLAFWRENPLMAYEHVEDHLCKHYPYVFIRGFYESEGSLLVKRHINHYHRTLRMVNTDTRKITAVERALQSIGFKTTVFPSQDKRSNRKTMHILIVLGGMEELQRFFTVINPCIKGWR